MNWEGTSVDWAALNLPQLRKSGVFLPRERGIFSLIAGYLCPTALQNSGGRKNVPNEIVLFGWIYGESLPFLFQKSLKRWYSILYAQLVFSSGCVKMFNKNNVERVSVSCGAGDSFSRNYTKPGQRTGVQCVVPSPLLTITDPSFVLSLCSCHCIACFIWWLAVTAVR